jgi:TolA-binding protein
MSHKLRLNIIGKLQEVIRRISVKNRLLQKREDLFLSERETNKAILDIMEIKNDNSLGFVSSTTQTMVDEFIQNPEKYQDQRDFVLKSLNEPKRTKKIAKEISLIKKEIVETRINEITDKWVNESLERNKKSEISNLQYEADRDFVSESLSSGKNNVLYKTPLGNNKRKRTLTLQIIGLTAAVTAIFLIIRTLTPSSNLEEIYAKYYKPFNAISSISRSTESTYDKLYNQGIELYKQTKYQSAAEAFNKLIQNDTLNYAAYFFSGITQLELGNNINADVLLSKVNDFSSDFKNEALWYLALSYIKTREKDKAIFYLKTLSKSGGFYQTQAREILRILK